MHHGSGVWGGEQRLWASPRLHAQDAEDLDGLLLILGLATSGHENKTSPGSSPQSPTHHPAWKNLANLHYFCQGENFKVFFFFMWTLLIGENLFSDHLLWSIFQSLLFKLLWGLKYPIFQFKTDSKSKFFEVWIWNGRIGMVLLILYSIGSHM